MGEIYRGGFVIKDVLQLPYIHRFDIYHKNGVNYFIGATIATAKQNKEDWSVPGRIYVGELPEDLNEGIQIEVLMDGLYRNHGYYRDAQHTCGYFGSDQGIVKVTPPAHRGGQWQVEYVLSGTIGEIAVLDIDGDGEQEIMTIERSMEQRSIFIRSWREAINGYIRMRMRLTLPIRWWEAPCVAYRPFWQVCVEGMRSCFMCSIRTAPL